MSSDDNSHKGFQENSSRETLAGKLTTAIESNLNNDQFGVDSLAQAVGMSRSNLHRKLHKLQGVSTSQFIREYRLKRALEILSKEDITASETAYRVGFSSATYFNTCFHKFYGYTPGEVKSRTTPEIEERNKPYIPKKANTLKVDSEKSEKGNPRKHKIWAIVGIIVVSLSFFYYYSTLKKNEETESLNTIIVEKSIAVLPFKNWTGDPSLEYVSDGMTDAVISRLTKINSIDRIVPFTSILPYKETKKSINEIATELGVSHLLQGNLQISGDKIKINLQLINASTNNHFWSEEYIRDWKSDEIFKMQTEVVEGIAANMNAVIDKNELADIKKIPTKSKEAYSYYLQAEFQLQKSNTLAYANAIPLYEKAIALDSNFVSAYRGLASTWYFGGMAWAFYDSNEAWSNSKRLFEKALEIAPSDKRVEELLEYGYFYYEWDLERVERYYQRILKDTLSDYVPMMSADYSIKTGRYQNAIIATDKIIKIYPSSGISYSMKAVALESLGKTDEASALLNKTNSLYSDHMFYLGHSAGIYFSLGEYEKCKIQLDRIINQFEDYPPMLIWLNAALALNENDSENASKYLAQLKSKYDKGSSGSPAWHIALYHCLLKDYTSALNWLEKSYEKREPGLTRLREDHLLAPLRNNSRYKELYDKVGFSSIGLPIKTSLEN